MGLLVIPISIALIGGAALVIRGGTKLAQWWRNRK